MIRRVTLIITIIILLSLGFIYGCSQTGVYIPDGQAVQLRQSVKNAPVWVKTKNGKHEPATMNLPEGWYCLPDDDDK